MVCTIIINKKIISEARIKNDPNIVYTQLDKKGLETDALDKVNKLIVTLKGGKSNRFSRLLKQYDEIKRYMMLLDQKERQTSNNIREIASELIDASDEVYTKVVETASFTLKINAANSDVELGKSDRKTTAYKKVIDELENHLTPELKAVLKTLVEQYTTISQINPSMTVTPKNLNLSEGIFDKIKEKISKITNFILKWSNNYDKKLKRVEELYYSALSENDNSLNFKKKSKDTIKSLYKRHSRIDEFKVIENRLTLTPFDDIDAAMEMKDVFDRKIPAYKAIKLIRGFIQDDALNDVIYDIAENENLKTKDMRPLIGRWILDKIFPKIDVENLNKSVYSIVSKLMNFWGKERFLQS